MTSFLLTAAFGAALCAAEKAAVLEVADAVERDYVIEETAFRTARELRTLAEEAAPRRRCDKPKAFTSDLTKTLRTVSGDGHFYIEPAGGGEDDGEWLEQWRAQGAKNGYGVARAEVMDGNIGLVRIASFYPIESAYERYNAAFTLVRDTDALILDLRGNGGGVSETEWPTQWTFLEKGAPLPLVVEARSVPPEQREEPPVLWPRYGPERPLAILVDKATFSAPEAVAYGLQSAGRAVVVGEASGGGAHMLGEGVAIAGAYMLYTPIMRPVSPATGANWEGVGVEPDIAVPSEKAVEAAINYLKGVLNDANG